jgi:hypothetical protein
VFDIHISLQDMNASYDGTPFKAQPESGIEFDPSEDLCLTFEVVVLDENPQLVGIDYFLFLSLMLFRQIEINLCSRDFWWKYFSTCLMLQLKGRLMSTRPFPFSCLTTYRELVVS